MNFTSAPFIKWTGSKRFQAKAIVDLFPKNIDTYYECFLGGGSVLHELLIRIANKKITCNKIVCSDINKDLINIFNILKNDRYSLYDYYCEQRNKLKEYAQYNEGEEECTYEHVKKAQVLYYENRKKFNSLDINDLERAYLLYWLSRTSFNGLIRFNPKGEFNAPFHVGGRFGITPEKLKQVIDSWGYLFDMLGDNLVFINDSFDKVVSSAKENDVVYMDPPYENTTGMYYADKFNIELLYDTIRKLNEKEVKVFLSYDGFTGKEDRTAYVPEDIYVYHTYIKSGRSSFKLMKSNSAGTSKIDDVSDSLYINHIPKTLKIKEPKKLF